MQEFRAELEVMKLRIENTEQALMDTKLDVKQTQADIHKIVNQLSNVKYTLIGIIIAESPQTIEAVMKLMGIQ